jgi:hypothetical protein
VSRFFTFQVFATFIYNFLLGSAMSQVSEISKKAQEILDEPTKAGVNLLGVAAAQQASFFMSFIMIKVRGCSAPRCACCHSRVRVCTTLDPFHRTLLSPACFIVSG